MAQMLKKKKKKRFKSKSKMNGKYHLLNQVLVT